MLKSTIFREYDIRGIAEAELTDSGIEDLGRAIGTYLQRQNGKNINLGRDCRLSSERLRNALIAGLKSSGCDVTDIGVVPTALLYYSFVLLKAAGAVMITGSHNPAEYNGFKVVSGSSTIHGEQIQQLREMIGKRDFLEGAGTEKQADLVTPYVEEVASQFQFGRRV
jgi:phosphomannomutase/phosphoglucomutase